MGPLRVSLLLTLLCGGCVADIVMHIPRGSNNRLNEDRVVRRNNNRLFNSQNNNRGGYNVGDATDVPFEEDEELQYRMKYFQSDAEGKSYLDVEWTNQHGCGAINGAGGGAQKRYCEVVMQYMCQDDVESATGTTNTLRNGISTDSQNYKRPNRRTAGDDRSWIVEPELGMHEPWSWINQCHIREANGGLFLADQELGTRAGYSQAMFTRQNNNGARSGYECPEERDYYPYWQPSPWTDVAVLTSDVDRCDFYKENSFNARTYGRCFQDRQGYSRYITQSDCEADNGEWVQMSNYAEKRDDLTTQADCEDFNTGEAGKPVFRWAVPYDSDERGEECLILPTNVDCQEAPFSRMNHQGNGLNGQMMSYRWELPYFMDGSTKRCVFRMRYNISTFDYDPWNTFADQNGEESPITGNPDVDVISDGEGDDEVNLNLQIALNTAQYGRTFQDRSHVFKLLPREDNMQGKTLYNVNVRGKRGNIVQTYPSVEYDFSPNDLKLTTDDLVHFQWTGSNTHNNNGAGAAGEGEEGTDRSNLVPVNDISLMVPIEAGDLNSNWSEAEVVWTYFGKTDITPGDLYVNLVSSGYYRCMNAENCPEDEHADFLLSTREQMQNQLNNSPASYGGVVLRFTKAGDYWFMCTRNNNFTNRAQKGGVHVSDSAKK